MRRVTIGALILITFLGIIVVGNIAASDLDALWMSLTPEGPAQADFPSGTETVYAVFEYTGFIEENVRVVVSNYSGAIIFDETQQFSGTGTASIPVTYGQGVFPDGLYVTTLYFAGQYLTQAVEWTVGGVELPTTPTPFPPAQLEVEPRTLTFSVEQGGSNPPAQRVRVSNSTAAASVWQATTRVPWISLVPEGGETPALLRVGVDATGLPAGTYTAQVIVSADDIADSPQTVDVSLTIVAPADTTTLDVPAVPDGTGWVVSDEPLDNHFDDAEIQAGLQAGLDYIGGLQFDLSTIPDGSDIRAVAVILPELRWETQPPDGGWVLELVDGDLAEGWANLGYTDVADAVSRVRFVHVQNVDNLGPDGESIWYLDGAGLSVLESVTDVSNFAVMRLRYEPAPPSDPGADIAEGLFVWDEAGTLLFESTSSLARVLWRRRHPLM